MFGKIIKIENKIIHVENLKKEPLTNLIGYHVVFEDKSKLVGEIIFVGDLFENKKNSSIISRIISAIIEGFKSLKLFFNPLGALCLIYIFVIAPIIVGGKDVATLVDGESITDEKELNKLLPLQLLECNKLEDSYIQLKYKVL